MNKYLFFLVAIFCSQFLLAQSPHGPAFSINCATCHHPENWTYQQQKSSFTHDNTAFPLTGQHQGINCRSCHTSLEFDKVESACISCHVDVHQQTVGHDCARCHTPQSWIVENITLIHEQTSFPLVGVHANINCNDCHQSESTSRYSPTGVMCMDCHRNDFVNAQSPNHIKNNFSNDCAACHGLNGTAWNTEIIDHRFFPLEQGHQITDCKVCHLNEDYSNISSDCISCHRTDYNNTQTPNHIKADFNVQCMDCHTLAQGWKPVTFNDHDIRFFPIYSGSHKDVWNDCNECHNNAADFSSFTCVSCHKNPETDQIHTSVSGYFYMDNACLACHPTGNADMAFDHNTTQFPLTGAHRTVQCLSCHANGFEGTSTTCVDCHTTDFNTATNPNHTQLGISNDCASCHTTEQGWSPASFSIHDTYFALNGAHAMIANDCARCHNGDYNNTPNTCFGCHSDDYNNVLSPNHKVNNFDKDCATCHSENGWTPSTFNHDGLYFPIFSGKHNGLWTECVDCHAVGGDFTMFSCIGCHTNPETNNVHTGVSSYVYNDNACLACHPSGDADNVFDHNTTSFPLTGAHTSVDCNSCHSLGFEGTSTLCVDCHTPDFNQSKNPDHIKLGLQTDCIQCHTTNPGWSPATFSVHNTFYVLNGAHSVIASDCAQCHNGDYNNTPNTCYACHINDYTSATNPNHLSIMFPQDCTQCHSESAWKPSTFDHDGMYFPINSGKHQGVWNECLECHNTPGNWATFTCVTCHQSAETSTQHNGVGGYTYMSNACLACHPTGDADKIFDHNMTVFPLTGAHTNVDCISCHATGFENTSTTCVTCHNNDYLSSANPNHSQLNLSTDCVLCHTTNPGWSPATFAVHNDYYPLNGAHAAVSSDCIQCHNGDYNNTPNTCVGCHSSDYTATTDPNHIALQFPADCASCHSENAWAPSTFNHDGQYFPIYSGKHQGVWIQCLDCHNNTSNYAQFTCITCHQNPETNESHQAVGGYSYQSAACLACHPSGDVLNIFDHNTTNFPLSGAHLNVECTMCHATGFQGTSSSCVACHNMDFAQASNPNHVTLGLSTDCISCHTTTPGWNPASFVIHNDYYVLEGAHVGIANNCFECHNGNYNNTPNTCVGCHNSEFNSTTNPDHEVGAFPTNCTTCHSQNSWTPAVFDHAIFWPLTGAHLSIASNCVDCHNGNYNNTSSECVSCHQTEFEGSLNPPHSVLGFSNNCATCHTTAPGWSPATLPNHDDYYVLTGAHQAISNNCAVCHNGNYTNTPNTCIGCHQSDFVATTNPDHVTQQFPIDCISCHNQSAWQPSSFDHNTVYPILGAHQAIANNCIVCHINGNYTTTPNTCIGCHVSDFNGTTNPDHEINQFSNDCTACHSQATWIPSTFNHSTVYPLTGAHSNISNQCALCHINGNYSTTPNMCIGCHQSDYNTSINPNHNSLGLGNDCAACHTTAPDWMPALFPDHNNFYLLAGAHTNLNCVSCHNGNYTNTPNTCIGCHQSDYNGVTNPNHAAAQFPNDCTACHLQSAWTPATFNHDNMYFPIYSGKHEGNWNICTDCHFNVNNFNLFTCINCHEHNNQTQVNEDHQGVSGYQYNSNACYVCHPNGEG